MNSSTKRAHGMANKRPVLWSPQARTDLFAIWSYYRNEAGELVADRVVRAINEKCKVLQEFPLMGRARDELRTGLRSIPVSPHVVFYRVRGDAAEVVRVLHGRRDLDEIFSEGP